MKKSIHTQSAEAVGIRSKSRKGFTLLELVIVLTVLVALAGILLPTLPNLLQRSHAAVCSTNIPALNKAMLMYNTIQRQFPNDFDNLVATAGGVAGLPGEPADYTGAGADLTVGTLSAPEISGLNRQGITHVIIPADWDDDPTFEAHADGVRTEIVPATEVLLADAGHIQGVLGVGTGGDEKFVVFGVGQRSTIVGQMEGGIFEAPVHFDDGGDTPDQAYSRYVVVFQVADEDGNALSRARFVGASALHGGELENVNEHIAEFYEL